MVLKEVRGFIKQGERDFAAVKLFIMLQSPGLHCLSDKGGNVCLNIIFTRYIKLPAPCLKVFWYSLVCKVDRPAVRIPDAYGNFYAYSAYLISYLWSSDSSVRLYLFSFFHLHLHAGHRCLRRFCMGNLLNRCGYLNRYP